MSTKPRYSYSPLPSPRHTRLIRLHASDTDNYPIICDLVEVNIDDRPTYEALSYTWNNEHPTKPLEIVPAEGSNITSLLVTTNCARALRILRKRIKPNSTAKIGLWVDDVCIDQSSSGEKSAQVAMMAEIYRNAKAVLVWLGNSHAPPNRRSMMFFPLLHPFNELAMGERSQSWKPRWVKMLSSAAPIVAKIVERVLTAPYWTRAWTLQEFPHTTSQILCLNSRTLPIHGIGLAHVHFEATSNIHIHHRLFEWARREDICGSERPRLLSMFLPDVLEMECSNPQDRVYALRDLFPSVFGSIKVDYSRSVEDVFIEATRCLILSSQNLEALYTSCICDKWYRNGGPFKQLYNVPSWAIDWTARSDGLYRASDGLFREDESWLPVSLNVGFTEYLSLPASFSDDGLRLKLWGKEFSQISSCVSEKLTFHADPRAGGRHFIRVVAKLFSDAAGTTFAITDSLGHAMAQILRTIYLGWSDICKDALNEIEVERNPQRANGQATTRCGAVNGIFLKSSSYKMKTMVLNAKDSRASCPSARTACRGDWQRRNRDKITNLIEMELDLMRDDVEFMRSALNQNQDENIKLFTVITTIFVPLGFAASIFSMDQAPETTTLYYMLATAAGAFAFTGAMLWIIKEVDLRQPCGEFKGFFTRDRTDIDDGDTESNEEEEYKAVVGSAHF
ncbi:heterokaryon incompatibility protein [Colletotrichum chrysophilum]|uniref:Heterokaryon incompatibility protein n=1 Tax=Colletotrichum chrysophilum TaxID=1836956 RepID=A0AAD9EJN8_9PEZI|nr:heterokaryon incompatibility protein [Colletotrichum chrysophilum]